MTQKTVPYIAKPDSIEQFGCNTRKELERWRPEICGVCCLKMVGDAAGKTNHISLWELTQRCRQKGAFREEKDGTIQGIFYQPLLEVASDLGMEGRRHRWLSVKHLRSLLGQGYTPVLSVDLHKVDVRYQGGHLIVITAYDDTSGSFMIHDSSSIVAKNGESLNVSSSELARISNKRGLSFT